MARRQKKASLQAELEASKAFHIQPKNETQNYLLECIQKNIMTVAIGPAGTGKTYCTGMKAAQLFLKGEYQKIVLTRSNISTGKSLGHFPGTIEEKMEPWVKPILNVLIDGLGSGRAECMQRQKQIEVQPIETIRGTSFDNSIIIVDEAQNLTIDEIKAVTTRIGENTKLILLGDPAQSDLKNSDLIKFVDLCHQYRVPAPIVTFSIKDIVRSDIVANLVKMFAKAGI